MANLSVNNGAVFDTRDMSNWKAVLSSMTFSSFEQSKLILTSGPTTITITGSFTSLGGGESLSSYPLDTAVTGVTMVSTDHSVEYALVGATTTLGDVLASQTPYDLLDGVHGGTVVTDNVLSGSSAADWIVGTATADNLSGGAGSDVLEGGAGNDFLIGGDGVNTARYSGLLGDYIISDDGFGGYQIIDRRDGSPEGTDRLTQIQNLAFADGQVIGIAEAVTDKAPSAPTVSNTVIDENMPAGTVVGTLSSVDPEGQPITYQVLQASPTGFEGWYDYNVSEDFTVVDGKLVATRAFDFETEKSFMLRIVASDRGVHEVSSDIVISVGDVADAITGTKYNNTIKGGDLADTIDGLAGNDTLLGYGGNDFIKGGAGQDRIEGGLGADTLFGGSDKDVFIYRDIRESTVAASLRDTILDLTKSDKINLQQIDANTTKAGNQAFEFIGTHSFSGEAGELRYKHVGGDTYIYADVNGDKKADFSIHLDHTISLTEGYFIL